MTKEKLSWLVIRFLGLILAYKAIFSIIVLVIFLKEVLPEMVNNFSDTISYNLFSLGLNFKNIFTIIMAIYLLKYGRFVYQFIDKNILIENEDQISLNEICLFIIRGCGLWFAIAAALKLCNFLSDFCLFLYVKPNSIFFSEYYHRDLRNFVSFISSKDTLGYLINFVLYVLIAWYLLNRGKLIMRLLAYLVDSAKRPDEPVMKQV